jgi:hypothetical protein
VKSRVSWLVDGLDGGRWLACVTAAGAQQMREGSAHAQDQDRQAGHRGGEFQGACAPAWARTW